jgi:VWFA-related protein
MTPWKIAAVAAGVCAAVVSVTGQDVTFRARQDLVRVDALVTRNGVPVLGLQPSDFEVLDNGVPQRLDHVSFDEDSVNAILALDMSASVAGRELDDLRSAGRALLGALKPGDQSALVTFSEVVALRAPLSGDVSKARAALDVVRGQGQTSLLDGVYASLVVGEADLGRSLVIVFTDGVDSSSWLTDAAIFDTAKRSAAVVYAVAPSLPDRATFLRDLTTATGGRLVTSGLADLSRVFVDVLKEFRQRYVLGYSPQGVTRAGWHTIEVRVRGAKGRGVTVNKRPGYLAGP